jgi:crossover junction endodeoxyribonuclease RuvC
MPNSPLKIIGIDPGYDRLGIAVIEKLPKNKEKLLYSTCIQTSSKDDFFARLAMIGTETAKILDQFMPQEMAIEKLFITNNQKTAMRVAEARGVVVYEAAKRGITVAEYSPVEIKSAVTGDGTSDKIRIIKMVKLLISIETDIKKDDEYDAIAIALTHASRLRLSA